MTSIMYNNLNRTIENLSEIFYFALVKVSFLGITLPPLFTGLVNYFIYDFGDESFPDVTLMCVLKFERKELPIERRIIFFPQKATIQL